MKNKYWFYIDADSIVSFKRNLLVIYNSLNGKILEYYHNPEIFEWVKKLSSKKNLMVMPLDDTDLKNKTIAGFINDIRKNFMGDLLDADFSFGKPVQMVPEAKVILDFANKKKVQFEDMGQSIMKYLHRISLYLNNFCRHNCPNCGQSYRQFPWCTSVKKNVQELDLNMINKLADELKSCRISNINILGGDIFHYPHLVSLIKITEKMAANVNLYIHYLNAYNHLNEIDLFDSKKIQFKILVNFPLDSEKWNSVICRMGDYKKKVEMIFLFENEEEFAWAELIDKFSLFTSEFRPFFNGKNLAMFEKNLYVSRQDISDEKPSLNDIFARKFINQSHFGHLIVLTGGKVKANINDSPLGSISKDSIYDILFKELTGGKSWRQVRGHVSPCKSCPYQDLCPPLSHYNRIIGKNNLCDINPSSPDQ